MNDIDELIERLQEWAENEPDLTGYGGKVLKEAITALQEMQKENKRLDAALKEISLGVVAPMDFAKKAREGECEHEWIDATNKIVKSGEICLKCNAVRAGE